MKTKRYPGSRVSEEDKQLILNLYLEKRSIAAVSRLTGWSIITVNKYVKHESIKSPFSCYYTGKILQKDLQGRLIQTYQHIAEAAKITQISNSTICHCIQGDTLTAGGYLWERISE